MNDFTGGRADAAATRLSALRAAPPGVGHPYIVLNSAPDLVEACVRTGRVGEARSAYEVVADFARTGAPGWALALAARCRALLADDATAGEEFAEALRLHSEWERPFDRARTQLLFGEHLRRRRQRIACRGHLRAALETFEALGATPWAERARGELRASGETSGPRGPTALGRLTPQELQIVRLVREGESNKEIAAHLFLSPRTVEYHLSKVYTKVGIASRAELVAQDLAADGAAAS